MFDIGFQELALIFVIGLVILGPKRLPTVARTLGQWMGRARGTFNNLRRELEQEAITRDMRERMEKQMREMGLDENSILKAKESLLNPEQINKARTPLEPAPEDKNAPTPAKPDSQRHD